MSCAGADQKWDEQMYHWIQRLWSQSKLAAAEGLEQKCTKWRRERIVGVRLQQTTARETIVTPSDAVRHHVEK